MKFTNPWIDRRVTKVRTKAARAYLLSQGWKELSFPRPEILMFAGPLADSGEPIKLMVPADDGSDDYVQRIIELITNLAILEDRPAVAVLDDILEQATEARQAGNGQNASRPVSKRNAGK